jgi:hypothetical protein
VAFKLTNFGTESGNPKSILGGTNTVLAFDLPETE